MLYSNKEFRLYKIANKKVLMILSIAILRCRIYLPAFRKIAVNIRSNIFVKMPTSNGNLSLWLQHIRIFYSMKFFNTYKDNIWLFRNEIIRKYD